MTFRDILPMFNEALLQVAGVASFPSQLPYFGTSVEYPAMGVACYCWSVMVLLSEMTWR